jgi:general secretion pathway protein A
VNKKMLQLYGLKWNPFSPEAPVEGMTTHRRVDNFGWRIENLAKEGGFALITGDPGTGKSISLRLVRERLSAVRDLKIGVLSRPQSRLNDFYRELGDLFGVSLQPHNRWAGVKSLRERWQAHIDAALFRPVLMIDEAQEMQPLVLNELRFLCATELDSCQLLTTILAGDGRLFSKLQQDELLPLYSRVRVRLDLQRTATEELCECLKTSLHKAGNAKLMTPELMRTIAEHAAGNYRAMMVMAQTLLDAAYQAEVNQIDEKLFLEVFQPEPSLEPTRTKRDKRASAA